MARIDVIMPQMGESIAEGTLSRWLKKVGDEVKRDEPIFEISTDKVDAEIPAPAAGVLAEILVQEGQTVAVQTVVARLETEKAALPPLARARRLRAGGCRAGSCGGGGWGAPPAEANLAPSPPHPRILPPHHRSRTRALRQRQPLRGARPHAAPPRSFARSRRSTASSSPAMQGTGIAGRVTKKDILGYHRRRRQQAPHRARAARTVDARARRRRVARAAARAVAGRSSSSR